MTQFLSILAICLTVAIVIVAIQLIKADRQSPPQQRQQAAGGEINADGPLTLRSP